MVKKFSGLDEFVAAQGSQLGPTDWLEVTQERVNLFADATDDHQWIHVDPERAANGPFGGTIAHGLLTLSLLPHFTHQLYTVDNIAMAINYGYNKVRFITPVRVGVEDPRTRGDRQGRSIGRRGAGDGAGHGRDRGFGQAGGRGGVDRPVHRLRLSDRVRSVLRRALVDRDGLRRDEFRFVACEPAHGVRDVLGLGRPVG